MPAMDNLRTCYVTYRIIILCDNYMVTTACQLTSFINTGHTADRPQAWQHSNRQLQMIVVRQNKNCVHEIDMPVLQSPLNTKMNHEHAHM